MIKFARSKTDQLAQADFFRYAAFLLEYPNDAWREKLAHIQEELDRLPSSSASKALQRFASYALAANPRSFETSYVDTFDFSNSTSLFLTSRGRADASIQRMDLMSYSLYFEEAGYALSSGDLPDNLIALLELLSVLDDTMRAQFAKKMKADVKLLYEALTETDMDEYALLIKAIVDVLSSQDRKAVV
ncbi:MAG: hypothetical protein Q4E22_05270 [Coriobacteriia bacterium]|nr:hypothetical protein [Coriobacteriia bacterium]